MMDTLQSLASAKPDKLLPSIKKPIDQCSPAFTHALSPLLNRQLLSKSLRPIYNTYTGSNKGSFGSGKLIKALSDPPIFIDKNDSFIDQ